MPKTAVLQEWIAAHGGSENVAEVMARTFDAEVFTLWREDPVRFSDRRVHESWLASTPLKGRRAAALPLMSSVWRHTDLSAFDRILISSHAFAHHAGSSRSTRDADVFVYVHTPARYLWAPDLDHRGDSPLVRAAAAPLRRLDRARVPRQASFASNSEFVRVRTQQAWDVDSRVIHPPVDVAAIQAGMPWTGKVSGAESDVLISLPERFVLGASRFVSYKRLDAAIDLGDDLGLPVVLAGGGPDLERLRARAASASVPVTFIDRPTSAMLYALYEAAALFVFAAVEDFGIMPVEAMAVGTPVLVNDIGGAREGVELTKGGATTSFASGADRRSAAESALGLAPDAIREGALQLDTEVFHGQLRQWLGDLDRECP